MGSHGRYNRIRRRVAADAALAGRAIPTTQKPSIGCNIKWKADNEPEYVQ